MRCPEKLTFALAVALLAAVSTPAAAQDPAALEGTAAWTEPELGGRPEGPAYVLHGGRQRVVARSAVDVSVSPGGRFVLVHESTATRTRLVLHGADPATPPRTVLGRADGVDDVTWNAAGTRFAVATNGTRAAGNDLVVCDVAPVGCRRWLRGDRDLTTQGLAMSPSGSRVAFQGLMHTYAASADGRRRVVYRGDGVEHSVQLWTPHGLVLEAGGKRYFRVVNGRARTIGRVPSGGAGIKQLLAPAPDGRTVHFSNADGVYALDVLTSELELVAPGRDRTPAGVLGDGRVVTATRTGVSVPPPRVGRIVVATAAPGRVLDDVSAG